MAPGLRRFIIETENWRISELGQGWFTLVAEAFLEPVVISYSTAREQK